MKNISSFSGPYSISSLKSQYLVLVIVKLFKDTSILCKTKLNENYCIPYYILFIMLREFCTLIKYYVIIAQIIPSILIIRDYKMYYVM